MRSHFDISFEGAFTGNRQQIILHKYHLGNDVWHVCAVDSNNWYSDGYYKLNREDWTFKRLERDRITEEAGLR